MSYDPCPRTVHIASDRHWRDGHGASGPSEIKHLELEESRASSVINQGYLSRESRRFLQNGPPLPPPKAPKPR